MSFGFRLLRLDTIYPSTTNKGSLLELLLTPLIKNLNPLPGDPDAEETETPVVVPCNA